jgi:hypothetical protein
MRAFLARHPIRTTRAHGRQKNDLIRAKIMVCSYIQEEQSELGSSHRPKLPEIFERSALFPVRQRRHSTVLSHRRTPDHATIVEDDMAEKDDTSNVTRRRRRNRADPVAAVPVLATSDSDPPPAGDPPPPPRTLEEAIENVRTLLREARGMLHCLSEVLTYADDPDSGLHAEVAHAAARWISDSTDQLDLVKLRPLIEAARQRGGGTSGNDEPQGDAGSFPYQVRESSVVYRV